MMRQHTLSDIVKRRFVHCVNQHKYPVHTLVARIGLPPVDLCKLIANQKTTTLPLYDFFLIAKWLHMPLNNVTQLGSKQPVISELVALGMLSRGYTPTNTQDQQRAAREVGISVAVFRRALHNYDTFRPSIRTCNQVADWLSWTGFDTEDIAIAAGMLVRYLPNGKRITLTPKAEHAIKPYPCACGRAGCVVPAHIPNGPRRKWRSDACRMWAKRRTERLAQQPSQSQGVATPLPQRTSIVRFIMINERPVPVRF